MCMFVQIYVHIKNDTSIKILFENDTYMFLVSSSTNISLGFEILETSRRKTLMSKISKQYILLIHAGSDTISSIECPSEFNHIMQSYSIIIL